jgi:hypothetical protein
MTTQPEADATDTTDTGASLEIRLRRWRVRLRLLADVAEVFEGAAFKGADVELSDEGFEALRELFDDWADEVDDVIDALPASVLNRPVTVTPSTD